MPRNITNILMKDSIGTVELDTYFHHMNLLETRKSIITWYIKRRLLDLRDVKTTGKLIKL